METGSESRDTIQHKENKSYRSILEYLQVKIHDGQGSHSTYLDISVDDRTLELYWATSMMGAYTPARKFKQPQDIGEMLAGVILRKSGKILPAEKAYARNADLATQIFEECHGQLEKLRSTRLQDDFSPMQLRQEI